ncbi:hypothetical protein KUTeg_015720 [Tegillarca granosa]|uniref:Uncharacterized protein n=1 Tax=Tegillarca granosa TaxID=220873 RepID=A0ABQ9EN36_TEGGR|nr:hypothetical protein KUTeg_015720 [Tegillarca granosa]
MVFGQAARTLARTATRRFSTSAIRRSDYSEFYLQPERVMPFDTTNPYKWTVYWSLFCMTGLTLPTLQIYIVVLRERGGIEDDW